jgi:hypothetical protein
MKEMNIAELTKIAKELDLAGATGLILGSRKAAAAEGLEPVCLEEPFGDAHAGDPLRCHAGRRVASRQRPAAAAALGRDHLDVGRVLAHVQEHLAGLITTSRDGQYRHPIGIRVGERPQQRRIDHHEDGGGCADAERERDGDSGRIAWRTAKRTHGEAHVG